MNRSRADTVHAGGTNRAFVVAAALAGGACVRAIDRRAADRAFATGRSGADVIRGAIAAEGATGGAIGGGAAFVFGEIDADILRRARAAAGLSAGAAKIAVTCGALADIAGGAAEIASRRAS